MEMTTVFSLMKMLKIFFFLIHGLTPAVGKYMGYEFYGYNGIHVDRKGEDGHEESEEESASKSGPWERQPMPWFDPSLPRNVTSLKDSNAYLHCIVHNLGNKTVSWIREIDLHILTVAQYTYTADDRFEVIHRPNTNSWILKINSVQPRDSGRYTCQVNTHPTDPIEFPVYLSVFVPTAHILGSTERYVEKGSTINLTCIVNHNPDPITEIFWYHNNQMISYDSRDSRVSVITDRGEVTKTILLVHDAHDAASGTYSCVPSPNTAATVRIHILNETPAAMQTNRGCRHSLESLLCNLTLGSSLTASQVSFFLAWLLAFRYISIT